MAARTAKANDQDFGGGFAAGLRVPLRAIGFAEAIAGYQTRAGMAVTGEPSLELLASLR